MSNGSVSGFLRILSIHTKIQKCPLVVKEVSGLKVGPNQAFTLYIFTVNMFDTDFKMYFMYNI